MNEGKVCYEASAGAVGCLGWPVVFVLYAFKSRLCGMLVEEERGMRGTYHAIRDTVTDNLIDDIPGGHVGTQTLNLLLNMLGNDVGDKITGGYVSW